MLSNVDIIRELGHNIMIHPLNEKTIRGASINLTASNLAWSLTEKEPIVRNTGGSEFIRIPKHDTGLIETQEIIYISKRIGGTYHSRVRNVSFGASHIGTTLNPGWIGKSLIAVHNHMDNDLIIKVGEPFVTVVFDYLYTRSSLREDNPAARIDVFTEIGINLNIEEYRQIFEYDNNDIDNLRKEMKKNNVYKCLKQSILNFYRYLTISILPMISIFMLIMLCVLKMSSGVNDIIERLFIGYTPAMILAVIMLFIRKKE